MVHFCFLTDIELLVYNFYAGYYRTFVGVFLTVRHVCGQKKIHLDDFTLCARAEKKLLFFPLLTSVNDDGFFWRLESSYGLSQRSCYGARLHIGGAVLGKKQNMVSTFFD